MLFHAFPISPCLLHVLVFWKPHRPTASQGPAKKGHVRGIHLRVLHVVAKGFEAHSSCQSVGPSSRMDDLTNRKTEPKTSRSRFCSPCWKQTLCTRCSNTMTGCEDSALKIGWWNLEKLTIVSLCGLSGQDDMSEKKISLQEPEACILHGCSAKSKISSHFSMFWIWFWIIQLIVINQPAPLPKS